MELVAPAAPPVATQAQPSSLPVQAAGGSPVLDALRRALAAYRAGRPVDMERACREALAGSPAQSAYAPDPASSTEADAQHLLGLALHLQGRHLSLIHI